jgi:uncharacterized RDD family membrane protein YckC
MAIDEQTIDAANMTNITNRAIGEGAQGNAGSTGSTMTRPDIAPLWKRAVAYFLDWILLAVVGTCIGYLSFDALASIGVWGGAIGFAISIAYFGICDSRLRNGQSLGKVAMNIRVLTRDGTALNVSPAFARAAILLVPYFLIGIPFDLVAHFWSGVILSTLIFGTAFSLAYLLVFNRTTRQSLHDLAVGTYVVRANGKAVAGPLAADPLWRGHVIAVALLFVVAAGLPVLGARLTAKEPFASLLALQNLLSAEDGVVRVNVTDGATTPANAKDAAPVKTLSIQVAVHSKGLYQEAFADKIARIALDNQVAVGDKEAIVVALSYGYDIGIASAQTVVRFTHSPAQWRARLNAQAPQ